MVWSTGSQHPGMAKLLPTAPTHTNSSFIHAGMISEPVSLFLLLILVPVLVSLRECDLLDLTAGYFCSGRQGALEHLPVVRSRSSQACQKALTLFTHILILVSNQPTINDVQVSEETGIPDESHKDHRPSFKHRTF